MKITRETCALTSDAALAAVGAAMEKANELGVRVNVCVVDAGGNQIAFLRGDGAYLPSGNIARDKACTAAGFGASTDTLYKNMSRNPATLAGISAQPGIALFQGGLPICVNGEVIGGIGVSGASSEQDEICAQAGLDAIGL